jgi:penicillin-binding protein 1C
MRKRLRLLCCSVALLLGLAWLALKLVPLPAALLRPMEPGVEFTDRHGATLRQRPASSRFSREVPFEAIPPQLVHAVLAAEDKRFFEHSGVDVPALGRAMWTSLRQRRLTSGASTITQQLVKIAEPRRRTWWTKCVEAATGLRLERHWSKEQILAAYLNRVDFGNLNIGVAAAADYYFGKPLADLSHAEAALLAGLPRNPRRLNPHSAPAAAETRQRTVLRRMHANGWLTDAQLARAHAERLQIQPPRRTFRAPHFVDLLLRDAPAADGQQIRTTLDLELNRRVEQQVREHLTRLRSQNARNAAAVVIDNRSGDVLALVGSGDYFAPVAGQVNGAWARRSAGSTLKPFTYLLALEQGATAATVLADVPTVFATSTGVYQPENYNRRSYGPVRLRLALANSLNVPAVKMLNHIGGAAELKSRLQAWGLTTLHAPAETYGLGLTIGNAEVRLLELANAYATLARLGEYQPSRLLANGTATDRRVTSSVAPAAAEQAWLIADILSDNAARTLAFGASSPLRFDFLVAVKTGTSTDFRDNWAIGYTPEFTVGVWVGNFDGSRMQEVSGVSGAAPILHGIFEYLHRRFSTSWYASPPSLVEAKVHPQTGKLTSASRPGAVLEKFVSGNIPPPESDTDYVADGTAVLGEEYQTWLKNTAVAVPADQGTGKRLRLVSPVPGTTYIIDPDVPSSARLRLIAEGGEQVEWSSESLRCEDAARVRLQEGRHEFTARDKQTGEIVRTWIQVKVL